MKTKHRIAIGVTFAASIMMSAPANAGLYGDDLARCLVKSATSEQKTILVKWIFTVVTLHPAIKSLTSVTDEQRSHLNKDAAMVFQTLLTETCKTETEAALKYEGGPAIEQGFSVLGQIAARDLMSDPEVTKGMEEFSKYLDESKFQELSKAAGQQAEQ